MQASYKHTRFYVSNYSSGTAFSSGVANIDALDGSTTQVCIVNAAGTVLTTAAAVTAAGKVRLAFKEAAADNPRLTDMIEVANITTPTKASPATAYEKIDYIGYIGSGTASIETPANNTDYIARFLLKSTLKFSGDYPLWKVAAYRTTAATRFNLINGLYANIVACFAREAEFEQFCKFERLCSISGGGATTATLVNKSNVISVASASGFEVGGYIRVGSQSDTTYPVYKVTAISGTNLTIDTPYQGVSASSVTVGYITAANSDSNSAYYGIKITGVPRKFGEGTFKYQKADWTVQLNENFTSTTITNSVAANKGVGTYEEASELEWELQGNEGFGFRLGVPPVVPRKRVTYSAVTKTTQTAQWEYDASVSFSGSYYYVTIEWYNNSTKELIAHDAKSYKRIIVACAHLQTANNILALFGV